MKIRKKPRSSLPSSFRLQPLTDLTILRQAQAHAPLSPMRDKEPDSFEAAASGELPEAPRSPPRAALEVEEKVGPLEAGSGGGDKEELTSDAGGGGGSEGQLTDVDAAARPSDGGSEAKDGILEPPSDGGDNEKEGILESSDGVWSMDTVAEEKDYDTAVGGEVVVVREATVAEEKKNGALGDATVAHDIEEKKDAPSSAEKWDGLSNVGAVVTIAVAGTAGETVLERKEGDSSVTVAIAPKKQGIPRTSCYHGVTRHRWTGKYEAHLWDGSINIESRKRKGKQVYLGGYDTEEKAARAYDLAALKYWGINAGTKLNFPISDYGKELEEMKNMNQDEWVASLRRRSTCFSRGVSAYRGVTRRRKDGKWQARLGSVAGTRDIYLGAFNTEEEAAVAYDIAAVELRGPTAVTNFDISNYLEGDLRRLEASPSMKL